MRYPYTLLYRTQLANFVVVFMFRIFDKLAQKRRIEDVYYILIYLITEAINKDISIKFYAMNSISITALCLTLTPTLTNVSPPNPWF